MITGKDIVQLADRLSALPPQDGWGEAVWRAAIGRAYYGAFHVAQDFVIARGVHLPRGRDKKSVHVWTRDALRGSGNTVLGKAAKLLSELFDYRSDADYDLSDSDHGRQKLAQQCHFMACDIAELIANIPATDIPAIESGLQAWQRIQRGF